MRRGLCNSGQDMHIFALRQEKAAGKPNEESRFGSGGENKPLAASKEREKGS